MKSYRYIDNLPLGWDTISMKDATSLITDYVANGSFEDLAKNVNYLDTPDYAVLIRLLDYRNNFSGPFVYINKDSFEFLSKSELHGGELIIANVGENVGTVFQCPNLPIKMSLAPNAIMVNFKDGNQFYYYWLKSQYGQKLIRSIVSGCAQPKFNKTNFRELIIPHPKLSEQKRIANVLNDIDSKIAMNNKINKELDVMSKELYNYWFMQFDFPNEEGKSYKSSGGKMIYNEILKREIPEGWKIKSIFDAADVIYGYPYSTEYFDEDVFNSEKPYSIIRIRDILENSVSAKTDELADSKYITKKKDLLIGMDGYFHMNFWAREGDYVNQRITRIRKTEISTMIIYYQILPFIKHKEKLSKGSTVGHLSDKDMKQIYVLIPNNKSLSTYFDNILDMKIKVQNEIQELINLRDELLPMLMNGQVSVK